MAENSKLKYSSSWDIDQLATLQEVTVASGTNTIATIPVPVTYPVFEMQFKPSGSTKWYQMGYNSSNATLAGGFTFYGYVLNGNLYAVCPSAGTVRYFIDTDKVDN